MSRCGLSDAQPSSQNSTHMTTAASNRGSDPTAHPDLPNPLPAQPSSTYTITSQNAPQAPQVISCRCTNTNTDNNSTAQHSTNTSPRS